MNTTKKPILIMAGGTGGHIFPALAVAKALQKRDIPVYWLGTRQGMEFQIVPAAGIEIFYIPISGLRRSGLMRLLIAPFKIVLAIVQTISILRRCRPAAVLGMGGFVAGPGGIAAWLLRIPLLIHEQNAVAGLTNRWLAKIATTIMQAFPNTFDSRYHAIDTGNPLREDIYHLAFHPKKYTKPLKILIIGGSLGAKTLNDIVPKALTLIENNADSLEIWHQVGQAHFEIMHTVYHHSPFKARISAFINNMAEAYCWADVVICRAGALTISELAQVGLPSILVPYPFAVDDHQTKNARFLVDKGAAILLPQSELQAEKLAAILRELLNSPEKLQNMASAAKNCAFPDALEKVVDICLKIN